MSEPLPKPAVYIVDGCVIDLLQVATVVCYNESGQAVCKVILQSGAAFNIDMQYSRSLIQAVEWSRYPGSVAGPAGALAGQCARVDNSWGN